jgi:hypothetical protein
MYVYVYREHCNTTGIMYVYAHTCIIYIHKHRVLLRERRWRSLLYYTEGPRSPFCRPGRVYIFWGESEKLLVVVVVDVVVVVGIGGAGERERDRERERVRKMGFYCRCW